MIGLLLGATLALASDCPWTMPPTIVEARMATLTVGTETIRVAGPGHRTTAEAALQACDDDTIATFREWRRARRATNTWAVIGVLTAGWGLIPIAWTAPRAGRFASHLETQLMTD